MLFYFVRHGQTEANVQRLLAGGGLDHPLTEVGHSQAIDLAREVQNLIAHKIHKLYVSSMTRAKQTAEYLSKQLDLPLETDADWREWVLGEWEGQRADEFMHLLLGDGEPGEGEARKIFYARVEQAWRRSHSDTEPYIVVSHGAVWLALQDFLQIPRFKVNNCSLIKVQAVEGKWKAEVLWPKS